MLTRRGAGRQIAAAAALTLLLVAVLTWLAFEPRGRYEEQISWTNVGAIPQLPGAPSILTPAAPPEPPPLIGEQAEAKNALTPFMNLGAAPRPFHFAGQLEDRTRARACLAAAMVYEAGDDAVGQLAVGQVILNRVRHPAFPHSICGVVLQGSDRPTGCQFTFTCDGSLSRHIGMAAQARALARATMMLDGMTFSGVGLATHYHTMKVYPWWSPRLEKIARVGGHLFFRWPGFWGSRQAMINDGEAHEPSAERFAQFGGNTEVANLGDDGDPAIAAPAQAATSSPAAADAPRQAATEASGPVTPIPMARRIPIKPALEEPRASVLGTPVLGGSRLLRMFPDRGVFFLELPQDFTQSAQRKVALMLCGGRKECHVYGWLRADSAPETAQLDAGARAAIAFSYSRIPAADARALPASANAI